VLLVATHGSERIVAVKAIYEGVGGKRGPGSGGGRASYRGIWLRGENRAQSEGIDHDFPLIVPVLGLADQQNSGGRCHAFQHYAGKSSRRLCVGRDWLPGVTGALHPAGASDEVNHRPDLQDNGAFIGRRIIVRDKARKIKPNA
jgi:hypothetical protein